MTKAKKDDTPLPSTIGFRHESNLPSSYIVMKQGKANLLCVYDTAKNTFVVMNRSKEQMVKYLYNLAKRVWPKANIEAHVEYVLQGQSRLVYPYLSTTYEDARTRVFNSVLIEKVSALKLTNAQRKTFLALLTGKNRRELLNHLKGIKEVRKHNRPKTKPVEPETKRKKLRSERKREKMKEVW